MKFMGNAVKSKNTVGENCTIYTKAINVH